MTVQVLNKLCRVHEMCNKHSTLCSRFKNVFITWWWFQLSRDNAKCIKQPTSRFDNDVMYRVNISFLPTSWLYLDFCMLKDEVRDKQTFYKYKSHVHSHSNLHVLVYFFQICTVIQCENVSVQKLPVLSSVIAAFFFFFYKVITGFAKEFGPNLYLYHLWLMRNIFRLHFYSQSFALKGIC